MSEPLFSGIDAGSSATKCVLLDGNGLLVSHAVLPSGLSYTEAAARVLDHALKQCGRRQDEIVSCVSTGYGRKSVAYANRQVTEISCHARGALHFHPGIRHVVDIGGQDTKVIWVDDDGKMADYRMNAKCAAGTGTFLESIALRLGMSLDEIDRLAMTSSEPTVVNSYCTVFAGTEVLERIKEGQPPEDIAMGLFRSIATRMLEMISSPEGKVVASGGVVTHCEAMVRALEEVFDTSILLAPLPQHAGAYGAALSAMGRSGVADHAA